MDDLWPQIESYLTVWWGVPGLVWILAATEGVKRLGVVPCRAAWIVSLAFGILGGVRAAFLASGLFSAARHAAEEIRRGRVDQRS